MKKTDEGIMRSNKIQQIQFHLTNKCNLDCLFCWVHNERRNVGEMPDGKWLSLVEEAISMEPSRIVLSGGGEPMLRHGLVLRLMEQTKDANISGDLITNGFFVSDEVAERIVALGWDSVHVTLHGPDDPTDSLIRNRKKSLYPTMKGLQKIVQYKEKMNSELPEILVCMVITKYNYDKVFDMTKLVGSLKLQGLQIRLVNENCPDFEGELSIKGEHMPEFLRQIRSSERYSEKGNLSFAAEFHVEDIERFLAVHKNSRASRQIDEQDAARDDAANAGDILNNKVCPLPFSEIVIFSNGLVSPCCNFFVSVFEGREKYFPCVDDLSEKSLRDVWEGPSFNEFRKRVLEGNYSDVCMNCPADLRNTMDKYEDVENDL